MTPTDPQSPGLYYTEFGSGPALLLIHGALVGGDMFEPVLDRFSADHRVIVPDLRGHGRSRTLPGPYAPRDLAADLAALLGRLGVESAAVLGYSNGGTVAQQLALDWSHLCDRLVLACTFAFNMATPRERIEGLVSTSLLRLLGPRGFGRLIMAQAKDLGPERAAWLAGLVASQDRRAMVRFWKDLLAFDSRPRLGEITCPTLIVAGADDTAVPIHHAHMLNDGIRDSQLVVVVGATHSLLWTHTEQFLQATQPFLSRTGAGE